MIYNYHFSNLYANFLSFNSSNIGSLNINETLLNYFGFEVENR